MSENLAQELSRLLGREGGRTAFQLSRALVRSGFRVDHLDVNKVLIRHPHLFRADRSTPPRWFTSPGAGARALETRPPHPFIDEVPELYPWQAEALTAWRNHGHRGVVEAVTGAGKTLVGIAAVRDTIARDRSAVILVPSTPLLEQWEAQLRGALPGIRIALVGAARNDPVDRADVVISTVQTAGLRGQQLLPRAIELVVADECHRYGADTFSLALLPQYQRRLGLTATFARGDHGVALRLAPFFGEVCFRLGYEQALREEVIAPFSIALVGVELDSNSRDVYQENHQIAVDCMRVLIHRFGIPAHPFGEFLKAVRGLAREGGAGRDVVMARRYLTAFVEYRRALAETPVKIEALRHLAPVIREAKGTLVFTDSINAAEAANRMLNACDIRSRAIHSDVPLDERSLLLDRFRHRRIEAIVAPRVLDEGVDVPDADLGIIVAASRTRRQMVQRMGRILRPKPDGGRASFVILYAENTSEDPRSGAHETFLEEATTVATGLWAGRITEPDGYLAFLRQT